MVKCHSQADIDRIPDSFDDITVIEIMSPPNEWLLVKRIPQNSELHIVGESKVTVHGETTIMAEDDVEIRAMDLTVVQARDRAKVWAHGDSQTEAWGSTNIYKCSSEAEIEIHDKATLHNCLIYPGRGSRGMPIVPGGFEW